MLDQIIHHQLKAPQYHLSFQTECYIQSQVWIISAYTIHYVYITRISCFMPQIMLFIDHKYKTLIFRVYLPRYYIDKYYKIVFICNIYIYNIVLVSNLYGQWSSFGIV